MADNSDIVLGVTRAADAARQRAAVSRLEKLSGQESGDWETGAVAAAAPSKDTGAAWATAVQRAAANTSQPPKFLSPSAAMATLASGTQNAASAASADGKKNPYVQFEAMLLQNMIESMLPENAEAVFGSGTAGSIWKSMLAEKIATEIAETGALGIAKQIAAGEAARIGANKPTTTKADDT